MAQVFAARFVSEEDAEAVDRSSYQTVADAHLQSLAKMSASQVSSADGSPGHKGRWFSNFNGPGWFSVTVW